MISSIKYLIVVIIFYLYPNEVCTIDFGVVTDNDIQLSSNGSIPKTIRDFGLNYMTAATYDPVNKNLYVSDSVQKKIYRITMNRMVYVAEPIVAREVLYVTGMAFDHTTSTLYWTSYGGIYHVRVPIFVDVNKPLTGDVWLEENKRNLHDLAIDFHKRFLYWAKDDLKESIIFRSPLDVPDPKQLVLNLTDPRNITVDEGTNMLYWIDFHDDGSRSLHRFHLEENGKTETLIDVKEDRSLFVIALDDRDLYWIESNETLNLNQISKSSSPGNVSPTLISALKLNVRPIKLFLLSDGEVEKAGTEDRGNKENVLGTGAESNAFGVLNHYKPQIQHNHD